jgi:two-component sensor histidine kinase
MSTLSDLLAENTRLSGSAADHLQAVVAEWQLLADLSFADYLLWVQIAGEETRVPTGDFVCVAQARSTTGLTSHPEDVVGTRIKGDDYPQLAEAVETGKICAEKDLSAQHGVPIKRETIPVRFGQSIIAVLSRETSLAESRSASPLESAYLSSAADLCQMIADGTFPTAGTQTDAHTSPRVGDGFIRLDSTGAVVFASPNGLSAYHRMGYEADLVGAQLAPLTRSLIRDPFDATEVAHRITDALEGEPGNRTEADSLRGAVVLFRALPLRPAGISAGALLLVRDVTEVKRRDRALLSKDATIREIHHRVKNNLQTVAALLRLQSRRTTSDEARQALEESVRRVSSIALVHEALSVSVDERVDLDKLLDNVLPLVGEVATPESRVSFSRVGTFGVVDAEIATPLAMVLTELVQNAVGHAFPDDRPGRVEIRANRSARWLDVLVSDDGQGLPEGFSLERADGLGLQIARTLIESELRGSLSLHTRAIGGTEAAVRIPFGRRA